MIIRQLLTFTLTFLLLFQSEGFAAPLVSNPLADLLIQHREIKTGVGSMELIAKHGKSLLDATYKMMGDPKNRAYLNSADGMELQKHQQMLANFIAVKDHFEKCIKDKEAKRKLHERVLSASFQSLNTLEDTALPCLPPNVNSTNKSFLDFNNGVMKAMKATVKPYFQNQLSKQIITNTAKSLMAFRQKFNPDFMKTGYLSQKEMDAVIGDVCQKKMMVGRGLYSSTDVCKSMDPAFKKELANDLISFSKTQDPKGKMTPESATTSLNASIDRLNSALSKIKVKKDVGYIYDSADLTNDENAKKGFDGYINQYMAEVSKDAGPLLLTKTMKDEAGSIKRFHSDDTTKNKKTTQFQFIPHKKIETSDVKDAIKEAEGKMLAQAHDTLNIAYDATKTKGKIVSDEDDIAELVKIYPFAAGQLLLKKPEYAGLMCDSINKINKEDVSDENFDKYFAIGTAVIGGALLLTGVGTVAGAYMITGSLTAGVAAGTIGGSILGYTALAGSAVELASAGYYGKKSFDQYQEMNRLEAAYLTRNSDSTAIIEAKNALVEFKDARMTAGISLASVGLSLASAGKLFSILKSDAKISPDQVKAATKILRYLGQTQMAKRVKDVVRVLGEAGMEKLDTFLLYLAKAGESSRIKFLELLKDGKITPEKIKEIVEASLEAAKNCGKV